MMRFLPKYLRALAGSVFLFSVGWLIPRNRFLIYLIARHFGEPDAGLRRTLPTLKISELLPGSIQPALLELDVAGGNVSLLELTVLTESVRREAPSAVFEIGTFDGRTTLNLAANAPQSAVIHTLDLPSSAAGQTAFQLDRGEHAFVDKPLSGSRFQDHPLRERIKQHLGDSATFDFSPFHSRIDWMFIDGSHAYEYVLSDTKHALAVMSPQGGTIFWHDYQPDWPGVITALEEIQKSTPRLVNLRHIEGTSLAYCRVAPR